MVDFEPSNDMDDLFGFGVSGSEQPSAAPTPHIFSGLTPQGAAGAPHLSARTGADAPAAASPSSRRAAREAAGTSSAAAAQSPTANSSVAAAARADLVRARPRAQESRRDAIAARERLSRPLRDRKAVAGAARDLGPEPAARKLQRHELALMNASAPKPPRKNPLSVLLTMAAVGGMFAVVGLPAYATTTPTASTATKTQADAQSIVVSSDATALAVTRDGYHATTEADLAEMDKDALRAEQNAAYNASGARAMGDDYPWPYELMEGQGGGLSPLNYYYRECVDFVAWRLNRDAGSYSAPFKWVWSNLTPFGGNGGQWEYNWEQHGWPVSDTPIKGAVAYTGGNHVAYVKSLNADGTITIEEYNYIHGMYGQRTLTPASIIAAGGAFLYPPPS